MDAKTKREKMARWNTLPLCHKEAENLDIILTCDGAASVGQVGHKVAVRLTRKKEGARMCCVNAVGAGSKVHILPLRTLAVVALLITLVLLFSL